MHTTIFVEVDDFCKYFEDKFNKKLLCNGKKRLRKSKIAASEVMTILLMFHYSGYKTFKEYYLYDVLKNENNYYRNLVSYSRFIELKKQLFIPMTLFIRSCCLGKCTGISIIDSCPIRSTHVKRKHRSKVMKSFGAKGKTNTGWFFGFKLHIVINHLGDIVNFSITSGNVSDANKFLLKKITKGLHGKLVCDRGYIGAEKTLAGKNIQVIHKIRKNMKNVLMNFFDKMLLRKRGIIETVNGLLKQCLSLEHSRSRSIEGFVIHVFSTIGAYYFRPKKPSIDLSSLMIS